jgi:hypothetical protein
MFDADTPWGTMELIIEERAQFAIADLRAQLAADDTMSDAQRTAMVRLAEPRIRKQTRATLEHVWHRMRRESCVDKIH